MLLNAHIFLDHSSPGLKVIKKKKVEEGGSLKPGEGMGLAARLFAGKRFFSSYTKVDSLIYDSGSVPE